jgi:hypothetical protein
LIKFFPFFIAESPFEPQKRKRTASTTPKTQKILFEQSDDEFNDPEQEELDEANGLVHADDSLARNLSVFPLFQINKAKKIKESTMCRSRIPIILAKGDLSLSLSQTFSVIGISMDQFMVPISMQIVPSRCVHRSNDAQA